MKTFLLNKKEIDSGQFSIEYLQNFSAKESIKIIVPKFCKISNGELRYIN